MWAGGEGEGVGEARVDTRAPGRQSVPARQAGLGVSSVLETRARSAARAGGVRGSMLTYPAPPGRERPRRRSPRGCREGLSPSPGKSSPAVAARHLAAAGRQTPWRIGPAPGGNRIGHAHEQLVSDHGGDRLKVVELEHAARLKLDDSDPLRDRFARMVGQAGAICAEWRPNGGGERDACMSMSAGEVRCVRRRGGRRTCQSMICDLPCIAARHRLAVADCRTIRTLLLDVSRPEVAIASR